MRQQAKVQVGKRLRQVFNRLPRLVMLALILGVVMACVPLAQPSLSQPESPPPGVLNSPLRTTAGAS